MQKTTRSARVFALLALLTSVAAASEAVVVVSFGEGAGADARAVLEEMRAIAHRAAAGREPAFSVRFVPGPAVPRAEAVKVCTEAVPVPAHPDAEGTPDGYACWRLSSNMSSGSYTLVVAVRPEIRPWRQDSLPRSRTFTGPRAVVTRDAGRWLASVAQSWTRRPRLGRLRAVASLGEAASLKGEGHYVLRTEAGVAGRVSVDGGAFQPLPVSLKADWREVELVVRVPGCEPLARRIRLDFAQDQTFVCEPDAGLALTVSTNAPKTHLRLTTLAGGDQTLGTAAPGDAFVARIPAVFPVTLSCAAPGYRTYERRILAIAPRGLSVACEMFRTEEVLYLRSNTPQTRLWLDGQLVGRIYVDAGHGVHDAHARLHKQLEPGALHYLTGVRPGMHQLCASAPGVERWCGPVEVKAGEASPIVELHLVPPKAPTPRPMARGVEALAPVQVEAPVDTRRWVLLGTVLTGLTAAVGVGLLVEGRAAASASRDDVRSGVVTEVQDAENQREAERHQLWGAVIGATGLALSATGGVLLWTWDEAPGAPGTTPPVGAAVRWSWP